jgi:hypothetical protein
MSSVTPGYVWTGATDPITFSKLNLAATPTVAVGTNEVTLAMMAQVSVNTILGRYTTGTGNVQAIDLTTQGLGFYAGAGSTVTQQTNKSTGVTISYMTGTITMNNAALNAGVAVGFTVTNTKVAATDIPIVVIKSGATADSYNVQVDAVASGSFRIQIRNHTAGNLSEAVVLSFAIIKGVAA